MVVRAALALKNPAKKSRRHGDKSPFTRPLTVPEIPRILPERINFPRTTVPMVNPPRKEGA